MKTYIQTVLKYIQQHTSVYVVDVVNEAITTPVLNNCFREVLGYPGYVIDAFTYAKAVQAPPTKLRLNETFGTANGSIPNMNAFFDLIDTLIANGVAPDAAGIQSHLQANTIATTGTTYLDRLTVFMDSCQSRGIEAHVTEYDMVQGDYDLFTQAIYTEQYFRKAYAHAACTSFSTWGVYDGNTWLSTSYPAALPLLFDTNFAPKLSYELINTAIRVG